MKIDELHRIAELIRFRYGLALPPAGEAQSLIRLGRAIWQGRETLVRTPGSGDLSGIEDRTRTDLIDLMVLWAELRGRFGPVEEIDEAKREALLVLAEVETLLGSSPAIEQKRRAYESALGLEQATSAPAFKARSAWEHFDLGKSYLRSGEVARASHEFGKESPSAPKISG